MNACVNCRRKRNKTCLYFTCHYINYHCFIDSCWYLLLSETKTPISILRYKNKLIIIYHKIGKSNELKEIDTKNPRCYYFDDIMKVIDIYSKNILLEKKIYKNNLIYDVSNKTFMGSKTLRIWFDKIDGFIKIYGGIYEGLNIL